MSNMPIEFLIDNDVNNDIAMELLYLAVDLLRRMNFPTMMSRLWRFANRKRTAGC